MSSSDCSFYKYSAISFDIFLRRYRIIPLLQLYYNCISYKTGWTIESESFHSESNLMLPINEFDLPWFSINLFNTKKIISLSKICIFHQLKISLWNMQCQKFIYDTNFSSWEMQIWTLCHIHYISYNLYQIYLEADNFSSAHI